MILDEQDAHRLLIRPLVRTYDILSAYRDDLPWCSERGLGGGVTAGLGRPCCSRRSSARPIGSASGASSSSSVAAPEAERAALLREKGDQRRRIARLLALHQPKEAAQVLAELDDPGELTCRTELP